MVLSIMRTATADEVGQLRRVDMRLRRERPLDQPRQVDRAQQAGAIGRQRLLAAGIGRVDRLAIVQVVAGVDAVDEDHAGLGVVVGGARDLVQQRARRARSR